MVSLTSVEPFCAGSLNLMYIDTKQIISILYIKYLIVLNLCLSKTLLIKNTLMLILHLKCKLLSFKAKIFILLMMQSENWNLVNFQFCNLFILIYLCFPCKLIESASLENSHIGPDNCNHFRPNEYHSHCDKEPCTKIDKNVTFKD